MDPDPITITDIDEGLDAELSDRIYEFNVEATGLDDGRLLRIAQRSPDGDLEAGLTGWTWGGCGVIDLLWIREDLRRGPAWEAGWSRSRRTRRGRVAATR